MTQEFHISVTPVGNEEYLVRTERVAPGVPLAEEQVTWAVEDWLAQARQLMNDPLLGVLQGDRVNRIGGFELSRSLDHSADAESSLPPLSLAEIGQQLYGALFQGTLRDSWMTAQAIAQHRGEVLRLRLGLKGSRLPRLPWEVLHETDSPAERMRQRDGLSLPPRPVATGTGVVFSRYQPGTSLTLPVSPLPQEPDQPLRILMVIAAPTDQKRLELKREATHLQQELRHQSGSLPESLTGTLPEIQLTILDQPGREQLTQALEQGQFQVLHYAGHSNLGASGGNLYLVNNKTGLTEILTGDDLAGLLVNNGIRMAVFNSCRGAYTAAADPMSDMGERNLAEALVGRGIPAVLAMAERIPDDVALTLSRLFYRNLKQGYPIDLSLSRARQGLISAYGSHQLYWALPILYLHSEFDGYLTEGDRTLDNPADRLMLIPQGYDVSQAAARSTPPLTADAVPDSRYLGPDDWESVLDDDLGDLTEDGNRNYSEYETELDEELDGETDLDYEDEASVVAGLLKQLSSKEDPQGLDTEVVHVKDAPGSGLTYGEAKTHSADRAAPPKTQTESETESDQWIYDGLPVTPHSGSISIRPLEPDEETAPQPRSTGVATAIQPAVQPRPARPTRRLPRFVLPLVGVAGIAAIALISFLVVPRDWFSSGGANPDDLLPPGSSISETLETEGTELPDVGEAELNSADTTNVTAIAIEHFNQGKFAEGGQAVNALLDRNALPQATAALATVPQAEIDQPQINFLHGRLAWQAVQAGEADFSINDARRYWEAAVREQPNNADYRIALGFAYYAESQPSEAIQEWVAALSLLEEQQAANLKAQPSSQTANADLPLPEQLLQGEKALNAYAGIALALQQAASERSANEQSNLESKSVKLYQMVMMSDPTNFQAEALSNNWLWTQEAIQSWSALAQR
ncbi:CHAT domain-containing protein [Leptolyngbya sp. FACHB-541]|uniref:CHAT domain-containing protein n=1 Tax=Leptolyngbya sp. FACHB-541 TaxID=2692810 RepID=UPI00168594DB|nr:CHAT domain-containing protein [Leptolyngbya sp. FACHB-541]